MRHRTHTISNRLASLTGIVLFAVSCLQAQPPKASPRAVANIASLTPILSEYEQAAQEWEQQVNKTAPADDAQVASTLDSVRLRIDAVRSVRTIITTQPDYLAWHIGAGDFQKWKAGAEYFLECAKSGRDPFAGKTSGMRTVRSPTDGQILFYEFRLPQDYDPAKRYPLDVSLHSGAGLLWKAGWIGGPPSNDPRAASPDGRIWINPCGRGNNCYAGMGEVAVMDSIRDVMKQYSVDPDRVTIGGASMGGTGGFRLAALHPDVFAAAHSLTGGANYAVPVNDGRYDATLLVDNFCNTGMCIWDAPAEGWYKQNHAFANALRERAQKFPGSYPVLELTDPKGGHGIIDTALQKKGREWLKQQRRDPHPLRVVYKTYNLRYDGAYWVHIDSLIDFNAPARIEAEVLEEGGKVRVSVENVSRFRLDLTSELVGSAQELTVTVNDAHPIKTKPGQNVLFALEQNVWQPSQPVAPKGLVKRHGLSGPIQDIFMEGKVLIVHGPHADANPHVDSSLLKLFGPGDGAKTLHTEFSRKTDRDVSAADIADSHLVLVGTPKQNAFVQKIADQLPLKFLDDGVEIGGQTYRGEGIGLTMIYPNPLNSNRYILLLPEQYDGGEPLDLPDYVVGRRAQEGNREVYYVLKRGSFDGQWKMNVEK